MNYIRTTFIIMLLAPSMVFADNIPNKIFGKYVIKVESCFNHMNERICEKFHWDTIDIQPQSSETAFVSIETETTNGHGCAFRGIGRWDGEFIEAIGRKESYVMHPSYLSKDTPWGACKVSIAINKDSATYHVTEGTEQYCHFAYCSARGWLNNRKGKGPSYSRKQ
ncbi:MAG TPA: hypothetical protein ENG14_01920 [Thermodesulforhabdus norvegica]|uniref:DUF3617 family protein n=1 Tax=Thermodesulforhabdus norvegica TaxID=39841 RepID=A0A7C1AXY1_9BACT|nr:hypothetical protein [Thermodesulforhabdus norvegica]